MTSICCRTALVLSFCFTTLGCAAHDDRLMYSTASALTKLSSAVEATVLYKNPSQLLSDEELLRLSAASDPQLLREFDPFTVRVAKHASGVILLVCKASSGTALLEDASCTARLDRHHWREASGQACEFTLKMPDVCAP